MWRILILNLVLLTIQSIKLYVVQFYFGPHWLSLYGLLEYWNLFQNILFVFLRRKNVKRLVSITKQSCKAIHINVSGASQRLIPTYFPVHLYSHLIPSSFHTLKTQFTHSYSEKVNARCWDSADVCGDLAQDQAKNELIHLVLHIVNFLKVSCQRCSTLKVSNVLLL